MGDDKPVWNVKLTFTPPLSKQAVSEVMEYIEEHDYVGNHGDDGLQWHEMPVSERVGWGYWGFGKMSEKFQHHWDHMGNEDVLQKIQWIDTFNGSWEHQWLYRGQDVGKLFRALNKQKCMANGTIVGTHFAVKGNSHLFVVDNTFRSPIITMTPGERVFEDNWPSDPESDEDEEPAIKRSKQ